MKISIIVPVYNIKDYINQCIDSLINQCDFTDYEIILVDDGSTDGSGKICDSYADVKNIKVFHKKNGGLSSARNYGIKKSIGKYLMFIDGDDYLYDNKCLKKINKALKSSPDILQYKHVDRYNGDRHHFISDIDAGKSNDISEQLSILSCNGSFSISAWDKIVKSTIIKSRGIFFNENLLSEDIDWSLRLYPHCKNLKILNENIYVYRKQRNGSITNTSSAKRIQSLYGIVSNYRSYSAIRPEFKKAYLNYLAYQYTVLLAISNRKNTTKDERKKIIKLKDILKYDGNYKVKMCNRLISAIGPRSGVRIMKIYLFLKNKGLTRL